MKILLTDEERKEFVRELTGVGLSGITYETEYDVDGLLKAQLKKVVEWSQGKCIYHYWNAHTPYKHLLRRRCPECMQALLKEVNDK